MLPIRPPAHPSSAAPVSGRAPARKQDWYTCQARSLHNEISPDSAEGKFLQQVSRPPHEYEKAGFTATVTGNHLEGDVKKKFTKLFYQPEGSAAPKIYNVLPITRLRAGTTDKYVVMIMSGSDPKTHQLILTDLTEKELRPAPARPPANPEAGAAREEGGLVKPGVAESAARPTREKAVGELSAPLNEVGPLSVSEGKRPMDKAPAGPDLPASPPWSLSHARTLSEGEKAPRFNPPKIDEAALKRKHRASAQLDPVEDVAPAPEAKPYQEIELKHIDLDRLDLPFVKGDHQELHAPSRRKMVEYLVRVVPELVLPALAELDPAQFRDASKFPKTHAKTAANWIGDSDYHDYKETKNQYSIRLTGGDRLTFLLDPKEGPYNFMAKGHT